MPPHTSCSHQEVLEALMPQHTRFLALTGFAFFGNSISISTRVEQVSDRLHCKRNRILRAQSSILHPAIA